MTDQAMSQEQSLSREIQFLAYSGWSPKEIEEKLGLEPYTIHIHHHDDLMIGYEKHIARYKKMPGKIGRPTLNITELKESNNVKHQGQSEAFHKWYEYYKRKYLGNQVEAQQPTP